MTDDGRTGGADLLAKAKGGGIDAREMVRAEAVLFEEEGEYGPVFILQLADFLKRRSGCTARTLTDMQGICEAVLHTYLDPWGIYSLHGGAFFVFRFGHLDSAEAHRRARQATDEIGRRLLGDRFLPFAATERAAPPHPERANADRPPS